MGKDFITSITKYTMPKELTPVTRDYTVNLHKRCQGIQFKKKARRAVAAIRKFAQQAMGTEEVKIDTKLDQFIWSQGVRNVPRRVRIRVKRCKDEDDEAGSTWVSRVSLLQCNRFKGLVTENNTGKVDNN